MALLEDVTLTDSIEIKTTPERIFAFLTSIVDDETYRAWHEGDHVSFRWVEGKPWAEGSVLCAEEYLHGKLHKLRFRVTKIVPNKRIEYTPVSRLLRTFFPKNEFTIVQRGEPCLFVASVTFRVGWIGKTFFGRAIQEGLASVKKHMREEGENLKRALEEG